MPYTATNSGGMFSLYAPDAKELILDIPLLKQQLRPEKVGDTWKMEVKGLPETFTYCYHTKENSFLLDPEAHEVWCDRKWGEKRSYQPLSLVRGGALFDWQGVESPQLAKEELLLYEMHIRGFHKNYTGCIEKIPHLLALGINGVELLPIFEFDELPNYWGYAPVHFFAPMNRYAREHRPGAAADELKTLIRELHRNGIEVILDVVYNHTGTTSLEKFSKKEYYILGENGEHTNYTGCGSTLNANHPRTRELILRSLRHYAAEYRVDGFRFDLAASLTRGEGRPTLFEEIARDPLLQTKKLILEPWDPGGLYQVGHSSPPYLEWNGRYRDDVRRYIKGTPKCKGLFAARITGSGDLYPHSPFRGVNFITCHDGFTLRDLVSYNHKHNENNLEENRDGTDQNESWNCGVEGETTEGHILDLRDRQIKNFFLALFLSPGIPMIRSGDEFGQTAWGNNNTWCQDNALSWIDWSREVTYGTWIHQLIQIRKKLSRFEPIVWHGTLPEHPLWNEDDGFIAATIGGELYFAFNASHQPKTITLPKGDWEILLSTGGPVMPPYSSLLAKKKAQQRTVEPLKIVLRKD